MQLAGIRLAVRHSAVVVEAKMKTGAGFWIVLADEVSQDVVHLGLSIQPQRKRELARPQSQPGCIGHLDDRVLSIETAGRGLFSDRTSRV